jgi:lipopolysaccharide transport system ATP-binding protein
MSSEIAIKAEGISKCYHIYDKPSNRLKQLLLPRMYRSLHLQPRNYFNEFWALNGVSFEIRRGETVGIVGRNGSGKSTLLQIICGTLNPTAGQLTTSGRIAALLELGSGFNPEFTGRENVYMNGALLGLSRSEIDDRYEEIVQFADIGDFIDQPVKTYSSGMSVRLAFAVAINADPEILVVDEALSVGDELFQRKCFSRIEAIKKLGATILFVSHSGGTVIELCDRAILMDSGENLAIGEPKEIVGQYQKLLYAPSTSRAEMREKIRGGLNGSGAASAMGSMATAVVDGAAFAGPIADNVNGVSHNDGPESMFDPNLVPTSTLEYESQGATIGAARIETIDGKQVNNLVRGETYRYCYEVSFDAHATNVRFGMLIKTLSGVELGGSVSAAGFEDALSYVEPGSCYSVAFNFRCNLNPGVYFLNAGVVGCVRTDETYLHRLVDVAMFRVMNVPHSRTTGIVDFACSTVIAAAEKRPSVEESRFQDE